MCNSATCSHDPFDDDFSDIFGGEPVDVAAAATFAKAVLPERFETKCRKCGGSGRFVGYTGRVLGNCFTCQGRGVIYTKTDPKVLADNRAKAEQRKAREAQHCREQAAAWLIANPAEAAWLRDSAARGFEFAQSLLDAINKYGVFTEKQEAAVRNATAKSAARKAQWEADANTRQENAQSVTVDRIAKAFTTAQLAGLKWPKLRLDAFVFSLPGATSRNAGAIYVKQDEVYLGKIADGKFVKSRDCDAETEARVVAVCADPAAAAEAYGQRTGQCACCGRELTNAESIARSIGPICASKWGWA